MQLINNRQDSEMRPGRFGELLLLLPELHLIGDELVKIIRSAFVDREATDLQNEEDCHLRSDVIINELLLGGKDDSSSKKFS